MIEINYFKIDGGLSFLKLREVLPPGCFKIKTKIQENN